VLFVSGYTAEPPTLPVGRSEFLSKPFAPSLLVATVAGLMH
jgi:hypothetical protein